MESDAEYIAHWERELPTFVANEGARLFALARRGAGMAPDADERATALDHVIREQAAEIEKLRAALREIADMDEVALVEWKKGDGWLHQRVARAALGGSDG